MKKFLSLALCGICAFGAMAFAGCDKEEPNQSGSNGVVEDSSGTTASVDILEGTFTATTLAEIQAFATNIVYADGVITEDLDGTSFDIVEEILANNAGAEFSAKSGDIEGSHENREGTAKVLNGKGEFVFYGPIQKEDLKIVKANFQTYCDGEKVYETCQIEGEEMVEKTKFDGTVSYGFSRRLGIEGVPDLKEWTEVEWATFEYYLDETDEAYTKIKIVVKGTEERRPNTPMAQTRELDLSILYVFNKQYKLQAFSFVSNEKTTMAYKDDVELWNTEYSARPWSGEIQAPSDLSAYQEKTN